MMTWYDSRSLILATPISVARLAESGILIGLKRPSEAMVVVGVAFICFEIFSRHLVYAPARLHPCRRAVPSSCNESRCQRFNYPHLVWLFENNFGWTRSLCSFNSFHCPTHHDRLRQNVLAVCADD